MRAQLTGPVPAGVSGGSDTDLVTSPPATDCQAVADALQTLLMLNLVVFAVSTVLFVVGCVTLARHQRRVVQSEVSRVSDV